MARTIVGLNDPKAVKKYSAALAVDVARESYFSSKFMSSGRNPKNVVQKLTDLETDAGEQITYDLSLQMTMEPIEGLSGKRLEGAEDELKFATANVYIDISRGGLNAGTRMTRKRTIHDLRDICKTRQTEWWARCYDEQFMMYAAGGRGTNDDFLFNLQYTGRANNPFSPPDAQHVIYGGNATSKGDLDADDKMTLRMIDRAKTRATMMGGGTQHTPKIQPIRINGADHFVVLMNPWDEFNLRWNSSAGEWLDVQKAAAGAQGQGNPIFTGALGIHNNVIMHSHQACIRHDDFGVGQNVRASTSLFLGRQALVMACGTPGDGLSFDWHEETDDRGDQLIVDTHAMYGIKKNTYNINGVDKDFGVITMYVASDEPA